MTSDCADLDLLERLVQPMSFEEFTTIFEPLPIMNWEISKALFTNQYKAERYTEFLKLRIFNDNNFAALMGKIGKMDIIILFLHKHKELGIGYTVVNKQIYIQKLEYNDSTENLIGKIIRDIAIQYVDSYDKANNMFQRTAHKSYENYMKIWSLAHLPSEGKEKQMEYYKVHYTIGTPINSGNLHNVRKMRFAFFDGGKQILNIT